MCVQQHAWRSSSYGDHCAFAMTTKAHPRRVSFKRGVASRNSLQKGHKHEDWRHEPKFSHHYRARRKSAPFHDLRSLGWQYCSNCSTRFGEGHEHPRAPLQCGTSTRRPRCSDRRQLRGRLLEKARGAWRPGDPDKRNGSADSSHSGGVGSVSSSAPCRRRRSQRLPMPLRCSCPRRFVASP